MSSLRSLFWAPIASFWCAAMMASPGIVRVFPLGGMAGSEATIEILGDRLSNISTVEFDSQDLVWLRTIESSSRRVQGIVRISPKASLGAHLFRAVTQDGYSTSAIFNVDQFPSVMETEPNSVVSQAQQIQTTPIEIQGRLDGAADIDILAFKIRKGERKVFDLRSIEHGSAVEARMILLDEIGRRVGFNDDRNDFDENPLIEHTFDKDGTYFIKLDQYRGPRGFNFGKNSSYILRVSNLPRIRYAAPLGLGRGRTTRVRVAGSGLIGVGTVYLTQIRRAEYARMTYPYTMPIRFTKDPASSEELGHISGKVIARNPESVDVEFNVPTETKLGLWRLWLTNSNGTSEGPSLEISEGEELSEPDADRTDWRKDFNLNGCLCKPGEKDVYRIQGVAGQPLHFYTLSAQLGLPRLDSVLQLRDASGKKLSENDDVVAGQGSLLGNADSSLFYTPKEDGTLYLTVRDRTLRGAPDFQYRLKVKSERPSFQLFTTPENFSIAQGGKSAIKVHLIREAGFEGEVSVWFDGFPPGVEAPNGKFRADQLFEPNADGADMIIPEIEFPISVPASVKPGSYPIRVFGSSASADVVEGHGTVMIGPILDLWNYIRRPAHGIEMTVTAPFEPQIVTSKKSLKIQRGETIMLDLKTASLPEDAVIEIKDLPAGMSYKVKNREGENFALELTATDQASSGTFEITVEAKVNGRWVSTDVIALICCPC